jgi:hypothetical protein
MGKFNYKDYLKNNPLTNGDKESLNESAPGFENRKQGEPLPTLDSVREEYEKKDINEADDHSGFLKDISNHMRGLENSEKKGFLEAIQKFVAAQMERL